MDHESALMTTASELINIPGTEVSALRPIRRPTPPRPKRLPVNNEAFQCHCFEAAAESKKTQMGSLAISSEARRDLLFGPMQRPVADEKEENADDDASADLRPSGTQAFGQAPNKKDGTSGEMPEAGGVKRRNAFNRISNCQVSGSPNDVNSKKARDDRNAMASIEGMRRDHR